MLLHCSSRRAAPLTEHATYLCGTLRAQVVEAEGEKKAEALFDEYMAHLKEREERIKERQREREREEAAEEAAEKHKVPGCCMPLYVSMEFRPAAPQCSFLGDANHTLEDGHVCPLGEGDTSRAWCVFAQ